jgi:hypothetical protein
MRSLKNLFVVGARRGLIGALLGLFAFAGLAECSSFAGKGTSGAQFLKLGVGARGIAMGEAYAAVVDGADAVYWNPAGLDGVERRSLCLMHALYLAETSYDYAGYAQRIGESTVLGVGLQYLNANTIQTTDEFGTETGNISPSDMAATLALSKRFFIDVGAEDEFVLGFAGKFIQSKIVETAQTAAADLFVAWNPIRRVKLTFGAQNMGKPLKFHDEADELPVNLKAGSALTLKRMILALDANYPRDADPYVSVGAEFRRPLGEDLWFAPRAGFNSHASGGPVGMSGLSAGAGLGWRGYSIDLSWTPFGSLGNAYRLSLSIRF